MSHAFIAQRIKLLGVPIDAISSAEAQSVLHRFLHGAGQHHVMTPNSEMLVEAHRNPKFHRLLQHTHLNLPDSAGLLWAARWTNQHLPERVTGVDTVTELCTSLPEIHPVFLLGGAPGIAEKAAVALKAKSPHLVIAGTYSGSPSAKDAHAIIDRINAAAPHLLLVAFGAPKQDLWIATYLPSLPSVRVAMGVGGTFDFLAGIRRRAPFFFQALHLEWLWRLCQEPHRFRRILTAVVTFPMLILRYGKSGGE